MDNSGTTTNKPYSGDGRPGNAALPRAVPHPYDPYDDWFDTWDLKEWGLPPPTNTVPGYSFQNNRNGADVKAVRDKFTENLLAWLYKLTAKPDGWQGVKTNIGMGGDPTATTVYMNGSAPALKPADIAVKNALQGAALRKTTGNSELDAYLGSLPQSTPQQQPQQIGQTASQVIDWGALKRYIESQKPPPSPNDAAVNTGYLY